MLLLSREDIKKVLVIGSGPIVIGQAAEFDYAGTQACRALQEEGVEVVLVNSNPATIMTDKDIADKVYIEPLTAPVIEKIIEKEKPDSILPTLGGQAALNLAMELCESGYLEKAGVELIGTSPDTIKKAEDRLEFQKTMEKIGEPIAAGQVVTTIEDGVKFAKEIGYPAVLRPAYTLGGSGGGIAHNEEELVEILLFQGNAAGQAGVEEIVGTAHLSESQVKQIHKGVGGGQRLVPRVAPGLVIQVAALPGLGESVCHQLCRGHRVAHKDRFHQGDAASFFAGFVCQSPAAKAHGPDRAVHHGRLYLEVIPVGDRIVGVIDAA